MLTSLSLWLLFLDPFICKASSSILHISPPKLPPPTDDCYVTTWNYSTPEIAESVNHPPPTAFRLSSPL